jgi:hypothetical protein
MVSIYASGVPVASADLSLLPSFHDPAYVRNVLPPSLHIVSLYDAFFWLMIAVGVVALAKIWSIHVMLRSS